jgi:hypothetical protein
MRIAHNRNVAHLADPADPTVRFVAVEPPGLQPRGVEDSCCIIMWPRVRHELLRAADAIDEAATGRKHSLTETSSDRGSSSSTSNRLAAQVAKMSAGRSITARRLIVASAAPVTMFVAPGPIDVYTRKSRAGLRRRANAAAWTVPGSFARQHVRQALRVLELDSNSANFVDFIGAGRGSHVLAKALVERERRVGTLPEQAELASEDRRNHALMFRTGSGRERPPGV